MPEHIIYGGKKITLEEYLRILGPEPGTSGVRLADKNPGDLVKIGKFEMIILEQAKKETCLLLKDLYRNFEQFGEADKFEGSNVDKICHEFEDELSDIVGAENILQHPVEGMCHDGCKKYEVISRKVSLLTELDYNKYKRIIDAYDLQKWWWLANPWTKVSNYVAMCVTAFGRIYTCNCHNSIGVRPLCILKSDILVSE